MVKTAVTESGRYSLTPTSLIEPEKFPGFYKLLFQLICILLQKYNRTLNHKLPWPDEHKDSFDETSNGVVKVKDNESNEPEIVNCEIDKCRKCLKIVPN